MDKIFAEGLYWNPKHENAPDYVVGGMSVKLDKALDFLREHANDKGYVNLNIKRGKSGKFYVELDTWQPGRQAQPSEPPPPIGDFDDDIPF